MGRRGREQPVELADDQPAADPVVVAREIALRQLTIRARTRAELETAMSRRGVPDEAMKEVLDRFAELGLVDDKSFSQQWVEGQQRRMRSRTALRHELSNKGVDSETIDEALQSVDDADEFAAALAFANKRVAASSGLDRSVLRRRVLGGLARRGFSGAVAYSAVDQAMEEHSN